MSEPIKPIAGKMGTQAIMPVFNDDGVAIQKWQLSQNESLSDHTEAYRFFSDAALVKNPWGVKLPIWNSFASETGLLPVVQMYTTPQRTFLTSDENFDHTVFAMPEELFTMFKQYVGTVAAYDPDKRVGVRVRYQDVTIPDP